LCWARREIVLAIADQIPNVAGVTETSLKASDVLVAVEPAAAQLAKLSNADLPSELAPVLERFERDVSTLSEALSVSSTVGLEQLTAAFDFEHCPALSEYLQVAISEPSCADA